MIWQAYSSNAGTTRLLIYLATETLPEPMRVEYQLTVQHSNWACTHAHRSSKDGSVVVVATTASPAEVTLNSISVVPFCHTAHSGLMSA